MKILLVLVILALFLINPILGLVGLSLVLFAILGYVLIRVKLEKEIKKEKTTNEEKGNDN